MYVACSSSVLTDSSHKLNVSEGEEKLTSVSTFLDRLRVPKVSDFTRRRKIPVHLAPCGKHVCKSTKLSVKSSMELRNKWSIIGV